MSKRCEKQQVSALPSHQVALLAREGVLLVLLLVLLRRELLRELLPEDAREVLVVHLGAGLRKADASS